MMILALVAALAATQTEKEAKRPITGPFKGEIKDPVKKDVLMRTARSKNAPVEERIQAIESLGRVLKLMLPGNFEDKMVVWTLVLLLDDDELKVREAAFACFKGMKDTFEYKPDGTTTERKAAMTKFRSWATQKCGTLEQAAAAK